MKPALSSTHMEATSCLILVLQSSKLKECFKKKKLVGRLYLIIAAIDLKTSKQSKLSKSKKY